jgi:hypothetical protein
MFEKYRNTFHEKYIPKKIIKIGFKFKLKILDDCSFWSFYIAETVRATTNMLTLPRQQFLLGIPLKKPHAKLI